MRTSCRFAMAVHVLTVLAYKGGGPLTSSFLASSVNTNPVVIRRLLLALQRAKIVETRKGAGSGSRLNRAPEQIDLAEVLRAVDEDQPFTMPRGKPNKACPVGQCIQTALQKVFASAEGALECELARTTLGDILEMVKASCGKAEAAA